MIFYYFLFSIEVLIILYAFINIYDYHTVGWVIKIFLMGNQVVSNIIFILICYFIFEYSNFMPINKYISNIVTSVIIIDQTIT